jgi:hypothetical protein
LQGTQTYSAAASPSARLLLLELLLTAAASSTPLFSPLSHLAHHSFKATFSPSLRSSPEYPPAAALMLHTPDPQEQAAKGGEEGRVQGSGGSSSVVEAGFRVQGSGCS